MAGDVVGPSAQQVAARLLVLRNIVAAAAIMPPPAMLEGLLQRIPEEGRAQFLSKLGERGDKLFDELREELLWPHVSPQERAMTEKGVGEMTREQRIKASWRVEAAQMLAWALGRVDALPPYDASADKELFKGISSKDAVGFVREARLRPSAEIEKARGIAELWHWRSRTRQLIERGEVLKANEKMIAQGIRTFDDIVRIAARKGAADGIFPASISDDFPAQGKDHRDLTAQEWARVRSITVERHFALNWLCGRAPGNRWDETPTGT